ncbi:MAG: tRNA 4-thiouridine(8) synthase ThiI [Desulfobacterales bacterium]
MKRSLKKVRALGLCSGGLDSMLAGLVLQRQGIEVEWVAFETPFFSSQKAVNASELCKIPLTIKRIMPEYIRMLKNPPAGYGKHMNPCMDCHALMFRIAGELMQKRGFDFLFSGEVLGQRPMSQVRPSLRYVEKHSGFDGLIVRPLSAKRLPETIPEKEGWIDRNLLFGFAGRSRKPQIALAKELGLHDYPAPAGGCLLTDKGYSVRLKDLFAHQETCLKNEFQLLKFGRHLRLAPDLKIIVGRTRKDNDSILKYHNPKTDIVINMTEYPGPVLLVPGGCDEKKVRLAAGICAGYSKAPRHTLLDFLVVTPAGSYRIQADAVDPQEYKKFLL